MGLPSAEDREAMLRHFTRRMHVHDDVNVEDVARDMEGWTGAQIKACCVRAALQAVRAGETSVSEARIRAAAATAQPTAANSSSQQRW